MSETTPTRVHATFNGEPIAAAPGQSVAAALIASGRPSWRTTRGGKPRGLFCGIGVCFDCIIEVDGEPGQRACMVPLTPGMELRGHCSGSADADATISAGDGATAGSCDSAAENGADQ